MITGLFDLVGVIVAIILALLELGMIIFAIVVLIRQRRTRVRLERSGYYNMAKDFSAHIYAGEKWRRLRLVMIAESGGKCTKCGGMYESSYLRVHHEKKLTPDNISDPEIVYGRGNLAVVCAQCHNLIHNEEDKIRVQKEKPKRNVYIISGAPLSGKTTYVNDVASPFDLIVDMDKLFHAAGVNPLYEKPMELFPAVKCMRDALYDMIKTRGGKHHDSYVITGVKDPDLERLAKDLSAEVVRIEATKADCLSRLAIDKSGRDKDKWREYIERWFAE